MLMSQGTLTECLEQTSPSSVGDVKGKVPMQEDVRPMSMVRHHQRGGIKCRKINQ